MNQTNEPVAMIALENTALKKLIEVYKDLLSSAYNIANRYGENTHWERFAGRLHINGISPVTAKTFKVLPSDDYPNTITITESEYAKLKKDAERYRFLRGRPDVYLPYIVINGKHHPSGIRRYTDIALDNVIDQARNEK